MIIGSFYAYRQYVTSENASLMLQSVIYNWASLFVNGRHDNTIQYNTVKEYKKLWYS